jgi:hypothetical protein
MSDTEIPLVVAINEHGTIVGGDRLWHDGVAESLRRRGGDRGKAIAAASALKSQGEAGLWPPALAPPWGRQVLRQVFVPVRGVEGQNAASQRHAGIRVDAP